MRDALRRCIADATDRKSAAGLMSVAFHGIYLLILSDFNETNTYSMYIMQFMDHLTFVTSPPYDSCYQTNQPTHR